MAGQRGRDVLIKVTDGGDPETYITLAGIRSSDIELNAQSVDGTAADSINGWREIVAGAGVKSARVRGKGIFKDAESDHRMQDIFLAGEIVTWQLIIPGLGTLVGPLHIRELKWGAVYDGEASFSVDLESAGALTLDVSA